MPGSNMSLKMLFDQLRNNGGKNKRESKEATGADIRLIVTEM